MTDTCFIFKNMFGYDQIYKIPENMPSNVVCFYITDTLENCEKAKDLGWEPIFVDKYLTIIDSFEKRKIIAELNCYPERFIDATKFKYMFTSDSNVLSLDSNYGDFISKKSDKKALYLTSGCYSGYKNSISEELLRSFRNPRWKYNFEQMKTSVHSYLTFLLERGKNLQDTPVVSAKYIGWNVSHPMKYELSKYVYDEYTKHLQGNIIFSMALQIYPKYIEHYIHFKNDGKVASHLQSH